MKYYEVQFTLSPSTPDANDLLMALAGEAGFEAFEETATGVAAYIQQQLFDAAATDAMIAGFPIGGVSISYTVGEAPDCDWNEQWEQEGFQPIVIGSRLTIHDGRHLPEQPTPIMIEIDARQAFGTGTHETTRLMCAELLAEGLEGKKALDCGSGTGILSIAALKLGASHCTAYDIDEWSADNSRHNAVINGVDERMTCLCGDASVTESLTADYDVVMANINRNILQADMAHFARVLKRGGTLLLSGFFRADCSILEEAVAQHGLTVVHTTADGEWACIKAVKR